jgi:hypothetical protein
LITATPGSLFAYLSFPVMPYTVPKWLLNLKVLCEKEKAVLQYMRLLGISQIAGGNEIYVKMKTNLAYVRHRPYACDQLLSSF